jgi:uncharacterized repeat protein (TIGR01451 family)
MRGKKRTLATTPAACVAFAAAAVGLLGAGPAAALPTGCAQSGLTVTCTYTSGSNAFTVPHGVSTVHVIAVGGQGGTSFFGGSGGFGARVTGDLAVNAGDVLFAVVGGNGSQGAPGFNGGGGAHSGGGGGGGASDVRASLSDLSSRLLVAAGGGGGGGPSALLGGVDSAGGDGGAAGTAGKPGPNESGANGGGGGGAGTAGAGGAAGSGGSGNSFDGCPGDTGGLGQGGTGAVAGSNCDVIQNEGGGGGGGLYGGGGGGGGGSDTSVIPESDGGSGGGGGGSSLAPAGGTSIIDSTGTPEIVISYAAPDVLSPSSLDFGSQAIGSTSAAKTVTLSNTGSAPIAVSSVAIGGTNAGDFAISSDPCTGTAIAPGGSCAVQATFAPSATGPRAATLSFVDDADDSPQTAALSGTGTTLADVKTAISGPASAAPGSQDTYVITVSNAGPSTALNVVMTAQVPSGTKFVGVSTTRGSCVHPAAGSTSGTIACTLGDLTSGAAGLTSATFKIILTPKGGTIALVAQAASNATNATAATPDPNLANNAASLSTTVAKK